MNTTKAHRFRFLKRAAATALLALALPAAGEAGGPLDLVSDAQGHVAVSRWHTARFDGAAFELAARPGKAAETGRPFAFNCSRCGRERRSWRAATAARRRCG